MRKIRDVLRLRLSGGLSIREISRSTKLSVGGIQKLLARATELGLAWPMPVDLDDNQLARLFYPTANTGSSRRFQMPDWPTLHQELKRPHMTKQLLWEEYIEQYPNRCYSYSQYCERYRLWCKKQKRSMRQHHKAGEKCFVDYAGATVPIINADTGEIREAHPNWFFDRIHAPLMRFASRTTILRRTLDEDVFCGKRLSDLSVSGPLLIVNAADLRTGSAFYFSANSSGSWRLGELASNDISIGHAVTASASYPLLLPAIDENLAFNKKDGTRRVERVTLTDGGVYDNLGLAPLWPDRDPSISLNVSDIDSIICCRAGYGSRFDPPSQSMIARLKSAFACVHDRAQNATMKRLFDLHGSGRLKHVLLPYLGQNDQRLKYPPDDLVTREDTYDYPTDFSAMSDEWIDKLSKRGEQLTLALIAEHWPELLGSS